jgi:hypothetical protein
MVGTGRHQLRAVAADTACGQAVKVAARAHQTLIWERTRHTLRLRSALREFFPAALAACADLGLTSTGTLELLARAPAPAAAGKLTAAQISAALKRARRRDVPARTQAVKDALRGPQLAQPAEVTAACAAAVQAAAAVLITLNEQISRLEAQVEAHFLQHPDAEIYLSQPGIGTINGSLFTVFAVPPVGGRPPRAKEPFQEPTPTSIRRQPATPGDCLGWSSARSAPLSDARRAREVTGGQGVAGSNPAVPTVFSNACTPNWERKLHDRSHLSGAGRAKHPSFPHARRRLQSARIWSTGHLI